MAQGVSRRDMSKELFWRQRVSEQADSGFSVRAFCRERDLKEVAFYWWRRELARRDEETREASFVPVHVTDDSAENGDSQIEIVLADGRCVRVAGVVDRQMLTDVLDVLERRAC